ncbi:SUMF1/EgtB/PvdO family nonheme iron enzyme [Endothiovibrio diazotrophicus]
MNATITAHRLISSLLLIAFAALPYSVEADPVQWRAEDGGNNHWYDVIFLPYTAGDAEYHATEYDALRGARQLATITSAAEQNFVEHLPALVECRNDPQCQAQQWQGVWIGGERSWSRETWQWMNGEWFEYTNWRAGEPNDHGGNESCITLYFDGLWNDQDCSAEVGGFVVEYLDSASVPVRWESSEGGNGHWYQIVTDNSRLLWVEARDAAAAMTWEGMSGHLAVPSSREEADFIQGVKRSWYNQTIATYSTRALVNMSAFHLWLGGRYDARDTLSWVDGSQSTFRDWCSERLIAVDHYLTNVQLHTTANDGVCWMISDPGFMESPIQGFLVEYEPAPAAEAPSTVPSPLCASMDSSLTLRIPCIEVSGTRFSGTLLAESPSDSTGVRWRVGDVEITEEGADGCGEFDASGRIALPCVNHADRDYVAELSPVDGPEPRWELSAAAPTATDDEPLPLADFPGKEVTDVLGMEFVVIPGGSFMMGSPEGEAGRNGNEGPQHRVSVPGFLLMTTEVTARQWATLTGSFSPHPYCFLCPYGDGDWNDVQRFIRQLNERTGGRFRLPTEAEWEYAARAGSSTPYWWGASRTGIEAYANDCDADCQTQTASTDDDYSQAAAVGSLAPNGWGLYDMAGSVWELVQDCWHDDYGDAPGDGSAWEETACESSVYRGGSAFSEDMRSSVRMREAQEILRVRIDLGFRLAMDL